MVSDLSGSRTTAPVWADSEHGFEADSRLVLRGMLPKFIGSDREM